MANRRLLIESQDRGTTTLSSDVQRASARRILARRVTAQLNKALEYLRDPIARLVTLTARLFLMTGQDVQDRRSIVGGGLDVNAALGQELERLSYTLLVVLLPHGRERKHVQR